MKTRKRIRLRAKFLRSNYFKAEAPKINQSAINRELDKLFFESRIKNLLSNQLQGNVSLRKSLIISKNTSIPKLLLNQLLPKIIVVILFESFKISQINFPSIMKYQSLMRFRKIFTNPNQGKLVTMLILNYWKNGNSHLCFKLLIEWQITYGQTWVFLRFGVILDLKLSGNKKGHSRFLVTI